MDDNSLDTAIDDVAREMTAGELDASFRARVLDGIEPGFGIRDSGFGMWRAGFAALGVAALIVATVVVFRSQHAPGVEAPVAQAPAVPATSAHGPASARPSAPPAQVATPPHRQDAVPNPSRTTADFDALAPPPLDVVPLDVESIAVAPLRLPDSIRIDNLEPITPIAVVPLGEGDRP